MYYFYTSRNASQAADPVAPAASGKGRGGSGPGNMVVPVVVATAQRGDLPVYFNGLGTVTAFNTVTVRSRVDGQLTSIAFKEASFVNGRRSSRANRSTSLPGPACAALGQLAKDQVNAETLK